MTQPESVPKAMRAVYDQIVAITGPFCREHLNEEYAAMSRRLAAALCRKRPSPLGRGRVEIWACAVVWAIGTVNFLSDRSSEPSMSMDELCRLMGVSKSTAAAKAAQIRKLFRMSQLDPDWTLPSGVADNPLVWMISVDGVIVDVRQAPRALQEVAFRMGLIPYIPADLPTSQR